MGTVRERSIYTHTQNLYISHIYTHTHTSYNVSLKITIPISLNKKNKESGKITK